MRLIDYRALAEKLGIPAVKVYRVANQPDFPQKTNVLGPRTTRWVEEEVDEWINKHRSQEHGNDGKTVSEGSH